MKPVSESWTSPVWWIGSRLYWGVLPLNWLLIYERASSGWTDICVAASLGSGWTMLPSLLSDPSPNCMLQARTCVFVSIFRASIGGDAFTDPHFTFQEPLIGEDYVVDLLRLLPFIVNVNKDEVFTKEDIIIMIEMKTQICFTERRYSSNSSPNPTQLKHL